MMMANAVRTCARRGAASGSASLFASPVNAEVFCRAMSTSSVAKASGSRLGRHSVQVKGDKVVQAMDEIERRERMLRIPEILEKHRYHEKGYDKTRRQKTRKKWRDEFKTATRQLNWMNLLKDRGVPVPGQRVGKR